MKSYSCGKVRPVPVVVVISEPPLRFLPLHNFWISWNLMEAANCPIQRCRENFGESADILPEIRSDLRSVVRRFVELSAHQTTLCDSDYRISYFLHTIFLATDSLFSLGFL